MSDPFEPFELNPIILHKVRISLLLRPWVARRRCRCIVCSSRPPAIHNKQDIVGEASNKAWIMFDRMKSRPLNIYTNGSYDNMMWTMVLFSSAFEYVFRIFFSTNSEEPGTYSKTSLPFTTLHHKTSINQHLPTPQWSNLLAMTYHFAISTIYSKSCTHH